MKKVNTLLEIGCEEIPARFMPGFLADLKAKTKEKLDEAGLPFDKIETMGTYRRLTLYIEGLIAKQADVSAEVKGPPAEFAFDASGKHTKAALGFAKSQNIPLASLTMKTLGNKNYVFAQVVRKGQVADKALAQIFPEIIKSLYQPLAMRWGAVDFKFIRPIHWLLALCGTKIVKFELAEVKSSNKTYGHRFLNLKTKTANLKNADLLLYKNLLAKFGVIVDQNERKNLIIKQVEALAKKAKANPVISQELLSEVTFLVENPIAYLGKFKPAFLSIPADVLVTSMKKNQKYFALTDSDKKLVNQFILVSDGCKNKAIVDGNQKVLSARLADAKFFFEEDKKTTLAAKAKELSGVAFFKGLGSMKEKSQRMGKLAEWLGKHVGLTDSEIITAKRIAELAKADLTTKMVYEFPVLQGVMGREYAASSGETKEVAQGIFEHYLPRFSEDRLPKTRPGAVVALADKIDSLVGCFSIGSIPTGSVDPYGLRRAANGIIRILSELKIDLLLDEVIDKSYKLYELTGKNFAEIEQQLTGFISGRLKPTLLEAGIRYDVVDAVLANFNDILDVTEKAKTINQLVSEKWFAGLVVSADRVMRISNAAKSEEVDESALVDSEEKQLYEIYMKVNWEVGEAINKEEWLVAVKSLVKLTEPIEKFFDKVLVMHQDEKLKTNRLSLLKLIANLYLRVAAFQKIVLSREGKR